MLRTRSEWHEWCMEHGTSGDMVFDILKDWMEDEKNRSGLTAPDAALCIACRKNPPVAGHSTCAECVDWFAVPCR